MAIDGGIAVVGAPYAELPNPNCSPQPCYFIDVGKVYLFTVNCPADITPTPCGNGIVDVDDLLLVINSWGPCPTPFIGDCPADITGGPMGMPDGVVNSADLELINAAWGVCSGISNQGTEAVPPTSSIASRPAPMILLASIQIAWRSASVRRNPETRRPASAQCDPVERAGASALSLRPIRPRSSESLHLGGSRA